MDTRRLISWAGMVVLLPISCTLNLGTPSPAPTDMSMGTTRSADLLAQAADLPTPDLAAQLDLVAPPDLMPPHPLTWSVLSPANSPASRNAYGMVYDSARQRAVLFGGFVQTSFPAPPFPPYPVYAQAVDTWEFASATQSWSQPMPATSPPGRGHFCMTFDSKRGQALLFGGEAGAPIDKTFNDTWLWDGQDWLNKKPTQIPPAREGCALVFDGDRGRAVLFGGADGFGASYRSDTWEWDGADWSPRAPVASPEPRTGSMAAYDPEAKRVLLFGGQSSRGQTRYFDTWQWDGMNWTRLAPPQSPDVYTGTLVYDPLRKRMVLWGLKEATESWSSWEFDGASWARITPAASPSVRFYMPIVYDTLLKGLLLFGGRSRTDGYSSLNDTWIYR